MNHKERIEWLDHSGDLDTPRWRSQSEITEGCQADVVVESTGEVIFENEDRLIIASEKRLDTDLPQPLYRLYTNIYKTLIRKREELVAKAPNAMIDD